MGILFPLTDIQQLNIFIGVLAVLTLWRGFVTPWKAARAWEGDWKKQWFRARYRPAEPYVQDFEPASDGLNTVAIKSYRLGLKSIATLRHVRAEIKSIQPMPTPVQRGHADPTVI
jgi:hypothetical protein